ncbi:hypothetical protein [Pseudomonas sp. RA_5y_Pfl1_P24]
MSRKKVKPQITEAQILAQESSIPSIAAKAFLDRRSTQAQIQA